MNRSNSGKTKKIALIACAAVVLIGAAVYGYTRYSDNHKAPPQKNPYSGPTVQEKKETADNKQAILKRNEQRTQPPPQNTSGSKTAVSPVITSAYQSGEQVTVTAYTPGIFENGGTCTLTASKSGKKVEKTNEAFANATTTDCPPFLINRSAFPDAGEWNVQIAYSSNKAAGTSQTKTLKLE